MLAEAVRGTRMDEGLLKTFVSAEPLTARKLYHDERTFVPTTKLFMHTNYVPRMSEDDDAIWRRARILPFTHRPRDIDESIKPTLCDPVISGPRFSPGWWRAVLPGSARGSVAACRPAGHRHPAR